jgi:glycosyltransferase involved in cell wall biosynthesis
MKQSIINAYGLDQKKIKIINNPITRETILKTEQTENKERKYITIGRLSKLKGYIRLLEILSKLSFSFQYTIIGEGIYYHEIFKKINELGLNDKITYIKYTDNVFKYLVEQDMFLQGSYSEGFPNTLLESCAVGTPVIAFDVPGGTKEIVEEGVNGYLVNTEKEFLEKLKESKQWDPERVRQTVFSKFSKSKIICDYEKFFIEILN